MTNRLNKKLLNKHTTLEWCDIVANEFGMKVCTTKDGIYWRIMSHIVSAYSNISSDDFINNYTQTIKDRIYLSDKLMGGDPWSALCTMAHECRHGRQWREHKFFGTQYLYSTSFRTAKEADASLANIALRMWRWPYKSRSLIIDQVVRHLAKYGITKPDIAVLKSRLGSEVKTIDILIDNSNLHLMVPEAAFVISKLKTS